LEGFQRFHLKNSCVPGSCGACDVYSIYSSS
jgi:hypothetical protein